MENQTVQDATTAALDERLPHSNGHGGPSIPEWSPPRTKDDADQSVIDLSNDIGLILAQLAEDQVAWSARTGRTPGDYAAWRRRALFAKAHKEAQLRESKRVRTRLTSGLGESESAGSLRESSAQLLSWCRLVVEAWIDEGHAAEGRLGQTLARLAEYLDHVETLGGGNGEVTLGGIRARPVTLA